MNQQSTRQSLRKSTARFHAPDRVKTDAAPFFPSFEAGERDLAQVAAETERAQRVQEHRKSMRNCWPDWDQDLSPGAQVECGTCIATRVDGSVLYAYTAPCKIIEVTDDNETFIVEIDYSEQSLKASPWLRRQNGTKLRLDICELWVPVRILQTAREKK
jgi:hypothetical protein